MVVKARIYCRKCESSDIYYLYLGDNRCRCLTCGNEFDIYKGIIDPERG